jgi:hypothetical protein
MKTVVRVLMVLVLAMMETATADIVTLSYNDGTIEKTQMWAGWYNDGPHGPASSSARDNSLTMTFNTSNTGLANVSKAYIRFYAGIRAWDWGVDAATGQYNWAVKNNIHFDLNGFDTGYTLGNLKTKYSMPSGWTNGIGEGETGYLGWVTVPVSNNGVNLRGNTAVMIYFMNGGGPINTSIGIGIDTNAAGGFSGRGTPGWNDKTTLRWKPASGNIPGEYLVDLVLEGTAVPEPATMGLLMLGVFLSRRHF